MKTDLEILDLMQQDCLNAIPPFTASKNFWDNGQKQFEQHVRSEGVKVPETQFYNRRFSAAHPDHQFYNERGNGYQDVCRKMVQELKIDDLGRFLLSSTKPTNANNCVVDGLTVSFDHLNSLNSVRTILKNMPDLLEEPKVVLDLGAGWGRMGHVLLQLNPMITYCILDFPEVVAVSRRRMLDLFPEKDVVDYDSVRNWKSIGKFTRMHPFVFGTPQDLLKFLPNSIDLFISINSIQEMESGHRDMYLKILEDRVLNSYILASENAIHGRKEPLSTYQIPPTWGQSSYFQPGSMFWWPEYFQTFYSKIVPG